MNLIFKALSHPARRQIIAMLQKGPLTSGEIAAEFDMAWPSVTGHLAALKEADLVEAERDGNTVRYRLNISAAEEAVGFLLAMMQAAKPAAARRHGFAHAPEDKAGMTDTADRDFDFLEKAGFVLVALQFAIFSHLWMADGFDSASDGFPIFVVCTSVFVASQRRLAARPPNRGAARWIFASRAAVLAMLTLGTLAVGFHRIVPDAAPAPAFILRGLFALLWVIIALKGAGIGKLKPGSAMGLCVPWTRQSRLAWDRAHRALGRILFWGGLVGLATSLIVAPLVSFAMWATTVALAVAAALIESWRTWRLDPDRSGGRPS